MTVQVIQPFLALALSEQASYAFASVDYLDELVTIAASAAELTSPLQILLEAVAEVRPRLEEQRRQFVEEMTDSPEDEADHVSRVIRMFGDVESSLSDLAEALKRHEVDGVRTAAEVLQQSTDVLASDRLGYLRGQQTMGPTPFALINRGLFHCHSLKAGHTEDARFARLALGHLQNVPDLLSIDLDNREAMIAYSDTRSEAEAAATTIAALSHQVIDMLDREWSQLAPTSRSLRIGNVADGLMHAADRLSTALYPYLQAAAMAGPTSDPTVNIVLQAAQAAWERPVILESFSHFLEDAEGSIEAYSPLFEALERMRGAALTGDSDEMEAAFSALQALGASRSGHAASQVVEDDDILFDFLQGEEGGQSTFRSQLPARFERILSMIEAELASPGEHAGRAYQALDHMAYDLEQMRESYAVALNHPVSAAKVKPCLAAITMLEESIESLRVALSNRNPSALQAAQSNLATATEILTAFVTATRSNPS